MFLTGLYPQNRDIMELKLTTPYGYYPKNPVLTVERGTVPHRGTSKKNRGKCNGLFNNGRK